MSQSLQIVTPEELQDLLRPIGLFHPGGAFYREREKKYHEVLAFLTHILVLEQSVKKNRPLILLDCGCGRSYLSFILNAILTHKLGREAYFIGVDSHAGLIGGCRNVQGELGFSNMEFHAGDILHVAPSRQPDIVYALHACDTATDEAIAVGVRLQARGVVVVPCCQRYVKRHMRGRHPLSAISRHSVFKEQIAVMLTESARVLALEAAGYKVKVITFVSSRYTPKNLMIRALRHASGISAGPVAAYRELTANFRFCSALERLLPEVFDTVPAQPQAPSPEPRATSLPAPHTGPRDRF